MHINILGCEYEVIELDVINNDEELLGFVDIKKQNIYLKENMKNDIKNQTLLHEITHAILYQCGQHDFFENETLIQVIATSYYQIFKENKMLDYFKRAK